MVERNAEVTPDKLIEWPAKPFRRPLAPSGGESVRAKEERGSPRGLLWPATAAGSTAGFGRKADAGRSPRQSNERESAIVRPLEQG
jgi:hypothetical protein